MPLTPLHGRFRDLALREMRTVALHGPETIPDRHHGFVEFYCNERGCDCRRVLLHVVRSDSKVRKELVQGRVQPRAKASRRR